MTSGAIPEVLSHSIPIQAMQSALAMKAVVLTVLAVLSASCLADRPGDYFLVDDPQSLDFALDSATVQASANPGGDYVVAVGGVHVLRLAEPSIASLLKEALRYDVRVYVCQRDLTAYGARAPARVGVVPHEAAEQAKAKESGKAYVPSFHPERFYRQVYHFCNR